MTDGHDPVTSRGLGGLLLVIAGFGVLDLVLDAPVRWLSPHVAVELAFIALCVGAACHLWWGWRQTHRTLDQVRRSLGERQGERDAWRERAQELLEGLGAAIDVQMREWKLTGAERETALLLLKGLSHKEVAVVTGRSDRTVRQHAVAVYRKSGLSGRAELSAFFLEDLLLPASQRSAEDTPAPAGQRGNANTRSTPP